MEVLERLTAGTISKRQAAFKLQIGHATILRLLEEVGRGDLVNRVGRKSS